MIVNEIHGRHIPNGAVRPRLIVFPSPHFNHKLRLLPGQKPVLVEVLIQKLAVEALEKCILHRFAWLNKMQVHAVLGS